MTFGTTTFAEQAFSQASAFSEVLPLDVSRTAAFNFCSPFDEILPPANGNVGETDRAHLWGLFVRAPVIVLQGRSVRWYVKPRGRLAGKSAGPARFVPGLFPERPVVVPELEARKATIGPRPSVAAPRTALPITPPPLARRLTAALRQTVAGAAFTEMLAVQADLLAAVPRFRRKPVLQEPTAEEGPIPGTPPVDEEQDNEISDEDLEVILALAMVL